MHPSSSDPNCCFLFMVHSCSLQDTNDMKISFPDRLTSATNHFTPRNAASIHLNSHLVCLHAYVFVSTKHTHNRMDVCVHMYVSTVCAHAGILSLILIFQLICHVIQRQKGHGAIFDAQLSHWELKGCRRGFVIRATSNESVQRSMSRLVIKGRDSINTRI